MFEIRLQAEGKQVNWYSWPIEIRICPEFILFFCFIWLKYIFAHRGSPVIQQTFIEYL